MTDYQRGDLIPRAVARWLGAGVALLTCGLTALVLLTFGVPQSWPWPVAAGFVIAVGSHMVARAAVAASHYESEDDAP